MAIPLLITALVALTIGFAMHPNQHQSPALWTALVGAYAVMTAFSVWWLLKTDRLQGKFRFQAGDATLGFVTALMLLAGAWVLEKYFFNLPGTQKLWFLRIFSQVGDVQKSGVLTALLLSVALMEEVVWRGLVLSEVEERWGTRVALPLCTILYGLAHAPSAIVLADPTAGLNPMMLLAALGCGLCWTFLAQRTGRFWPLFFSHATFSYFAVRPLPFT